MNFDFDISGVNCRRGFGKVYHAFLMIIEAHERNQVKLAYHANHFTPSNIAIHRQTAYSVVNTGQPVVNAL